MKKNKNTMVDTMNIIIFIFSMAMGSMLSLGFCSFVRRCAEMLGKVIPYSQLEQKVLLISGGVIFVITLIIVILVKIVKETREQEQEQEE